MLTCALLLCSTGGVLIVKAEFEFQRTRMTSIERFHAGEFLFSIGFMLLIVWALFSGLLYLANHLK
jgi:hypothetical protein